MPGTQRTFNINLAATEMTEEFLPVPITLARSFTKAQLDAARVPQKERILSCVSLGIPSVPEEEKGETLRPESNLVFVGEPSLRTIWVVQSVYLTFSIWVFGRAQWKIPIEATEIENNTVGTLQLGMNLYLGGAFIPSILTEVPLNNIKYKELSGRQAKIGEYLESRLYNVEFFSPVVVLRSSLSANLFARRASQPAEPKVGEFGVQLGPYIINPILQMTVEQQFVKSGQLENAS